MKTKKKIGIYAIKFRNGKIYVGYTTDFDERMKFYKRLGCKNQPRLYNALRCHGWEGVNEVIFMTYPPEMLEWAEKWHIKQYDSFHNGYNCSEGGEGSLGCKRSDETKAKISKAMKIRCKDKKPSLKTIEAARQANLGRKASPETVENIRKSKLGSKNGNWKGGKYSGKFSR